MDQATIYDRLSTLLRDTFDDDELVATPELSADDVDEWDSLAHVRLMLAVEKAFGVKFSAAEVNRLKNVGELATLIQSKQG